MMKNGICFLCFILQLPTSGWCVDDYMNERLQMLGEVAAMVQDTAAYLGKDKLSAPVMSALSRVPRHEFVPEAMRSMAYVNRPLPIGAGQTISQPYIVALMTDLAEVDKDDVVLEVGTGSGYQGAILAQLTKQVYTIEIIEELGKRAEADFKRLGYDNIAVRIGDGYHGWPEHAPFDAIIVTAAPEHIPEPLLQQLKPGGKLVLPVGSEEGGQSLKVITKNDDGTLNTRNVLPVAFVPFMRAE